MSWRGEPRRPGARPRLRHRPRGARPGRRGHDGHGLDPDAELVAALARARRASARLRGRRRGRRRARARRSGSASRSRSPRCRWSSSWAAPLAATPMLERVRDQLAAGRAVRRRARRPVRGRPRRRRRCPRCPTCSSSTAGCSPVQPVAVRSEDGGVAIDRLRQAVSPAGELHRGAGHDPARRPSVPTSSRPRRRAAACVPCRRRAVPETLDTSAARSCMLEAPRDPHPARLRALSRADEHLRRPRQHRGAACPLRVARARLRAGASASLGERAGPRRPRPLLHRRRAGPRPGGGRRRHGRRPSATPCTPQPIAAPSCSRSAAATSCSAHSVPLGDQELPGVGLVDLHTVREAGRAADRQLRDRGRPRERSAHDRGLREPRRAHLPRPRRAAARPRALRTWQQRPRRLRGRACAAT